VTIAAHTGQGKIFWRGFAIVLAWYDVIGFVFMQGDLLR